MVAGFEKGRLFERYTFPPIAEGKSAMDGAPERSFTFNIPRLKIETWGTQVLALDR